MSTIIKLKIQVDELDNVLQQFNQIKVYRSTTGISGTYSEITLPTTRIALAQGKSLYEFDDNAGAITYWYKTSYYKTDTGLESNLSDPRLGDDPSTANIMTVPELKDLYLFGVDLTNDVGTPYPDIVFEWGIKQAIAWMERELDIRIRPTVFVDERYDYYRNDYLNWTIIRLRESPVISVEAVKVKWPSSDTVIDFPKDWIQVRKDAGQVNIVPTSGSLSQVLLTAGGSFLPLVASGRDFVPNILSVDFTAGFPEGEVPMELRDLIGKMASFGPLNIAGDLIAGAGIASKSISIDGLSQSIGTTASATNAGYGARLIQYWKEITRMLPTVKRYYKGIRLAAL